MTIENLMLEHFRGLRASIGQVLEEIQELKLRMSRLESAMLSVKREVADGFEAEVHQQITNDKIIKRLERIEKRLDLQD